jgi:hypothetical protein
MKPTANIYRGTAGYVDHILKGPDNWGASKSEQLPVTTAKALDLTPAHSSRHRRRGDRIKPLEAGAASPP